MKLSRENLMDKIKIFVLAGIAKNDGSGWDYAIPQPWADQLAAMGLPDVSAWFVADCTGPGATPVLRHIGEAYATIVNDRLTQNIQGWVEAYHDQANGDQQVGFYMFIEDHAEIMGDVDSGFTLLESLKAAYGSGWIEGKRSLKTLLREVRGYIAGGNAKVAEEKLNHIIECL